MAEPESSWVLRFLYRTVPGRLLLRGLSTPGLSRLCGRWMDSRFSCGMIARFVRKNGIDLSEYESASYANFNDFFTRRIRPERRPIDMTSDSLIAPCDGLLSVYPIKDRARFAIKGSTYSTAELLGGDPISARFADGLCLVFRLCVNHYHRYCFFDDGERGETAFLPGRLHTVRPIALETYPVFIQNSRAYTVLNTEHFGPAVQVEVGALLVGKIENHDGPRHFSRGEEKGLFRYGGSTIVLLLGPGAATLPEKFLDAAARGEEIPVRMGQCIGRTATRT